jgi:uncharacterized protein (DUF433 family)
MDVSTEHIEIVQGAGGPKPRIKGTGIRVRDVVEWSRDLDWSVSKIVEEFPHLTPAGIYAALAYYWDHKDDLDAKWADDDAWVEEMRRQAPPSPLQEKLKQRQKIG